MTASFAATVVLPTRNEEGSIGRLLHEIAAVVDRNLQILIEVLVIDDSDLIGPGVNPTFEAVETAKQAIDSPYVVINWHHRPKGHRPGKLSGAMAEGLRRAQGGIRIYMDSDGQHPPAILPGFVTQIDAGNDIVVGSRYCRGGSSDGLDGPVRHIVSRGATMLVKALFPWELRGVSDPMSGCFAVREGAIDIDRLSPRGFKFLLDVLARHAHLRRAQVPLQFRARLDGESKAGEGNGAEFLKQVPSLRAATLPDVASFGLVGALTAAFGAALLWLLIHLGINPLVANAIQLMVTLAANFEIYRRFVWPAEGARRLHWQIPWFLVTRGISLLASWYTFAVLLHYGYHYQVANAAGLVVGMVVNYPATKMIFDPALRRKVRSLFQRSRRANAEASSGDRSRPARHRHRIQRSRRWKLKLFLLAVLALLAVCIVYAGGRTTLFGLIVLYSIFSLVTSSLEVRWRLYGRRNPEARESMKFPEPIPSSRARLHFFAIVPALDEAAVIGDTLVSLLAQTHPNFNILVSLAEGDDATIKVVEEVVAEGGGRISMLVTQYEKSSKPQQLNTALAALNVMVTGRGLDPHNVYVVPFDAEDDVTKDLLLHVEPLARETGADVVQAGVQLVNVDLPTPRTATSLERLWGKFRGWYCVHNCMEYFFWFSSRMFYQVNQGFVPLGGNTVFIRLSMLNAADGWPLNLTEDCALGVKLSVEHNARVVAAYDPRLATREETPSRLFGPGSLFRQRERWDQGFFSVLLQEKWYSLRTIKERLMALYILAMPLIQAANGLMLPIAVVALFLLIGPVGLVLVMYAPFVPIAMTICLQAVGLREFSREYHQKVSLRHYMSLLLGNFPYQIVLSLAALSAIKRHVRGENGWRLTRHDNLHRSKPAPIGAAVPSEEGSVA